MSITTSKEDIKGPLALKGQAQLVEPFAGSPSTAHNQPRALRALAKIIDNDLCHRCGSCLGICPTSVLDTDSEGYPRVANLQACTDCELCVRVCPGEEFNFPAMHQQLFGNPGDLTQTHGQFESASVAHATDALIREHSTSGGAITAILLDLLERGEIDGAAVVVSDDKVLWRGKPIIARTPEQLIASMKSKYAIVPTNQTLAEIRNQPGRYAVVGLPCQIHGIRKALELDPRLKERIVLTIGLFCHAAIEHEAFRIIWESLGQRADQATSFVSRIGKHPGAPHIRLKDGELYPVYFGNRPGYRPTSIEVINVLYRLFTPARCLTCFDGLSQFADISVGDPWLPPPDPSVDWYQGWSFVLARTARGKEIYDRACASGKLKAVALTKAEALTSNRMMATEKRWRAFRVIEMRRRQGKALPVYVDHDYHYPKESGLQFIKNEVHMLSHIFCFWQTHRASALRFMLGGGYWLFWLNNKRRRLRVWLRDSLYRLRTRWFGRK